MSNDFQIAIESYPWESDEQREGYLALIQHLRRFGLQPELPLDFKSAFFIQKDIESHAYWRDLMAAQISNLENVIVETREKLDKALSRIDQLEITVRFQTSAIHTLTKGPTLE